MKLAVGLGFGFGGCMGKGGMDSDMAGLLREGMMMVGGEGSVNLTGWNELWILPEIYEYDAPSCEETNILWQRHDSLGKQEQGVLQLIAS